MSKRAFMSAPEINLITVITEINKIFEPVAFDHRIPKRYLIELSCLNIENAMSKGCPHCRSRHRHSMLKNGLETMSILYHFNLLLRYRVCINIAQARNKLITSISIFLLQQR